MLPFQEALSGMAGRMPKVVREHEILRLAAHIVGKDPSKAADAARREVLAWAQRRVGGQLPDSAWSAGEFDYLAGGRNCTGTRIVSAGSDIWAVRIDNPDETVPGRTWTTEVVVGMQDQQAAKLSVRLLASTKETSLNIEPHTPGFVHQIADKSGLSSGGYDLTAEPWIIEKANDADDLVDMLISPARRLPAFVLTVRDDPVLQGRPFLDAATLARAMLGIGHVVVLPPEHTWTLTNSLGKIRSVFGGAVRAYLPGFAADSDPYGHRLVLAEHLLREDGTAQCARWMRSLAANESVRRTKLGHDVLAFAAIKNASLGLRQQILAQDGASDSEQLAAANARIAALDKQSVEEKATQEYFSSEHEKAEDRAVAAEEQLRASTFRIRQLLDQIKMAGASPDVGMVLPDDWSDLTNWCDTNLAGRLALGPAARRGIRAPEFEDAKQAARCLLWLAVPSRHIALTPVGCHCSSQGLRFVI